MGSKPYSLQYDLKKSPKVKALTEQAIAGFLLGVVTTALGLLWLMAMAVVT